MFAADIDQFKVKRQEVFAFSEKPKVARDGDRVTITFASKGFCDATVAIEDAGGPSTASGQGRIIRHLAAGCLGSNAPAPFQKDSLSQRIVWDGKDDEGRYVDKRDSLHVRVSLGLAPRFERALFWEPKKRLGAGTILLAADPEGVYVYDVNGSETVRLYGHDGNYVRTVYPFPADKVEGVQGLPWLTFPDGARAPAKRGYFLATLLDGRQSGGVESTIVINSESTGMAVRNGRLALTGLKLNRLATDGTSGGLKVWGPFVDMPPREYKVPKTATALAFSPDNRTLYLTGYGWLQPRGWAPVSDARWVHGVWRMDYAAGESPRLFLGEERAGGDAAHFNQPTDVAVDEAGRIYVADHVNDRVGVFSPEGKLLKSLAVDGPAKLALHHKTRELYVFSWFLARDFAREKQQSRRIEPKLRTFSAFPDLKPARQFDLPLEHYRCEPTWSFLVGSQYQVALDSWSDPTTVWLIADRGGYPILLREGAAGLERVADFRRQAAASGVRLRPVPLNRQRLYVDPLRGQLYLAEGDAATAKAFTTLVRIDPDGGRCRQIDLPFSPTDMAIGPDGLFYLRTGSVVGRYDPLTWREVPFDYGEECRAVVANGKADVLIGGLVMPSTLTSPHWHHGGMDVNAAGDLIVTCFNPHSRQIPSRQEEGKKALEKGRPYATRQYPGRWASGHELHIWDKHGRVRFEDVMPGQTEIVAGVHLDAQDNVYANVAVSVMLDGRPYYQRVGHRFDQVGTLVKFKPGAGKFMMAPGRGTPIVLRDPPDRPPELNGVWVDGAQWLFPGVGRTQWGMDCSCWNSRFALDYFARSFAPEYDRFSVAVLDSAGNLILRIGRYGNADDDLGLFDGCFVATQTDRRVFIADAGNARIVSVRLDYHASEMVLLK